LSLRRAAREIEFLLQSFILAAQPFVLALDAFALLAFSIPLTFPRAPHVRATPGREQADRRCARARNTYGRLVEIVQVRHFGLLVDLRCARVRTR
jgi:hypothetical protein